MWYTYRQAGETLIPINKIVIKRIADVSLWFSHIHTWRSVPAHIYAYIRWFGVLGRKEKRI